MRILGINFQKISCERKKPLTGKLKVNSNINLDKIEEDTFELAKGQNILKFNFIFTINYSECADLELRGFVIMAADKAEKNEVLKSWKKKKIPDKYKIPLFNMILAKCNIKALQLEEELNLPPHIPMPAIRPESSQQTNYTG